MATHDRSEATSALIHRAERGSAAGSWWAGGRRWTGALWRALSPIGRLALVGLMASAMAAIALGITITTEIRRQLLDAEGRGLQAAVSAIEPALTPFPELPLSTADIIRLDSAIERAVLTSTHVRAKLWALDGSVVYSDAHELIGRSFPEVRPRLADAARLGVISSVTDLEELENEFERAYARLIEFYVPVHDPDGGVAGILEIYEDVTLLEDALGRVSLVTWAAIGSGLAILTLFLVILVSGTVRSITRDRALAEARAAELTILVDAMDALSSSLEPEKLMRRLERSLRDGLGMSRLAIEAAPPEDPDRIGVRLQDGSWLVAACSGSPPTGEDLRVLRAVGDSLDAALANASLYGEVREAAQQRRVLLGRIAAAHDEERHRIVGELHDSLAGDLIRVLYGIRGIAGRAAAVPAEIAAEISRLEQLVRETERHLRDLMGRVRPVAVAPHGLDTALQEVISRARSETGLDVRLRTRGAVTALSPEAQLALVRATEEALINVRKHANARRVLVRTASHAHHFSLSVDDDGAGWGDRVPGADGRGLGLAYLQERVTAIGGTVTRERSHLGGARLVMVVPLEDRA